MLSCPRRIRTKQLQPQGSLPASISLQTQPLSNPLGSSMSTINVLSGPAPVSVSVVVVGPLASACVTLCLVGLFPPALDAAPHGGQQAGLRGVVGQ